MIAQILCQVSSKQNQSTKRFQFLLLMKPKKIKAVLIKWLSTVCFWVVSNVFCNLKSSNRVLTDFIMKYRPQGEWRLFQTVMLKKFFKRIMRPRTHSQVHRTQAYLSAAYLISTMVLFHRLVYRANKDSAPTTGTHLYF